MTNGGGQDSSPIAIVRYGAIALTTALMIGCGGSSSGESDESSSPTTAQTCDSAHVYLDVTNPTTGKTWLDRNLGADRVATSSTDHMAYGSLYQWGRASDGHECISWTDTTTGYGVNGTTETQADVPNHNKFIINNADWRTNTSNTLWDYNSANNPCPTGYRPPTKEEMTEETNTWDSNDTAGAFKSILKLPASGYRNRKSGNVIYGGSDGLYWTTTTDQNKSNHLIVQDDNIQFYLSIRPHGSSVRCIKD